MTNRIELNWNLDGFVDEQRYYCSETLIDINNLPMPKAILNGSERSHIDYDIDINKTYHIILSSVRNSTEKLSQQISVSTEDNTAYSAYFTLTDLIDQRGGASLEKNGDVVLSQDGAYFDGSSDWLQRAADASTIFGTGDLTVECEFKTVETSLGNDRVLIDHFVGGIGGWQIGLNASGCVYLYFSNPNGNVIVSPLSYSDMAWHKLKWVRISGLNKLYVDNTEVGSYFDNRDLPQVFKLGIGAQINSPNAAYDYRGYIKNAFFAKQAL